MTRRTFVLAAFVSACGGATAAPPPAAPSAPPAPTASAAAAEAPTPDAPRLAICEFSVCAIGKSGRVACWGNDQHFGTLGPNRAWAREPTAIEGVPKARSIACGSSQACAIGDDGATCWGEDPLDHRAKAPHKIALELDGKLVRVGVAASHACAVDDKGGLACWGQEGLLGTAAGSGETARRVTGASPLREVHAQGSSTWACSTSGEVLRFGTGYELFGIGVWDRPRAIKGAPHCEHIGANASAVCSIDGEGHLGCFGMATRGVLGDHDEAPAERPFHPSTGGPVRSVAMDDFKACALRTDDTVVCWGKGASSDAPTKPHDFPELRGAVEIAVGRLSTVCARFPDDRVRCAGERRTGSTESSAREMPEEVRLP